ncbi:hypothetical protein GS399_02260 [Pedobacter sp. HMF7647]|uniref:DUF4175 family protein n=1 Tax=Hufsiella arboris TaxID=2695275 RepID=A0A7K1Y5B9_9SPHI|nr:DUF4175 family protein [Hufsiella arboris]MXV49777.1 hypothetical protein [Hufsiella arboris]
MELGGNYQNLLIKIDAFIRKYYLNQVVRGCIYLAASLFISYLLVTFTEFYGNFSPIVRTFLFYGYIIINLLIFVLLLLRPLLSYFNLGKVISAEQAALIIGDHFSDVSDKLLNTLQLKKLAEQNPEQVSLISASINQRVSELRPVPFASAVRINENRKYLKYAVAPLIVIVIIAFTAPAIFSESTTRLIGYNRVFVKKAPFDFIIENNSLKSVQGDDFVLKVKMTGNEIPQDIYLQDGPNTFKLDKKDVIHFEYAFKNVQQTQEFKLEGGDFTSEKYTLNVQKKPSLINIEAELRYPSYLNKKSEHVQSFSDITVPCGTLISWKIAAQNIDMVDINDGKNIAHISPGDLSYSFRALQSSRYDVIPRKNEVKKQQPISYKIDVIPDLNPVISVNEKPDSVNTNVRYFVGNISDDYGFSRLTFHYRTVSNGQSGRDKQLIIPFDRGNIQSSFFHFFDFKSANAKPGESIEYYFEVFDNDGVHGPKMSRSEIRTFSVPTTAETQKKLDEGSESVKQKMDRAITIASQVESQAKKVNQQLLNKKELSFDDKKQVENLLSKQKQLEDLVKDIQKENKQNLFERQESQQERQQIVERQKQIEDLFNNVLDEKTKEILKNIQKLLDDNNKSQTREELSKMQLENKSLQKELDRILDLYKQLEFDQKLSQTIDKLNDLSKDQQQLSDKSAKKNPNTNDLKLQQESLNKDFKDLKDQLSDLEKKDNELGDKNNFDEQKNEQQQIEQQQQQSSKELDNNNAGKASQSQKKAAQQMQQLSQKLQSMQQKQESQENQINLQNLRQILSKLLTASFQQENVMQTVRTTKPVDPNYIKLTERQRDLKDNLKSVQDSLYQLSKRVPQIESVVNKEITAINSNMDKALELLGERKTAEANSSQQYAMTAINNLALMLSEVENKLQQAMKNSKPGSSGKQPSLSQLSQMQNQLNKNMEKARQQMQQQGKMPGSQGKGMSEQFSRMAQQQQMIRQSLQDINREMNKDGKGGLGNLGDLTKQMEQTETDLVNKRIQQETIKRQQDILTKLLDAEKAERERDQDQKRESKQGTQNAYNYKAVLEEYKKNKQSETEFLKTVTPSMNTFYKIKVEDYFKFLNSGK